MIEDVPPDPEGDRARRFELSAPAQAIAWLMLRDHRPAWMRSPAEVWRHVAGDFLSQHTRAVGLVNGVFSVQVEHPTLLFELRRRWVSEILKKLRDVLGPGRVTTLEFRPPEKH